MLYLYIYHFRLRFYIKNSAMPSASNVTSSEVVATIRWPSEGFRQITLNHLNDMPPLTDDAIVGYFSLRIAPDGNPHRDLQAIKKGRLIAECQKVEALSMLIRDTNYWFTGICSAAMKKGVKLESINIDLLV